eukprot:symbB.v1.2.023458.t1/scaffold2145.1/size88005/4
MVEPRESDFITVQMPSLEHQAQGQHGEVKDPALLASRGTLRWAELRFKTLEQARRRAAILFLCSWSALHREAIPFVPKSMIQNVEVGAAVLRFWKVYGLTWAVGEKTSSHKLRNLAMKQTGNIVSLNGREPWSFVLRQEWLGMDRTGPSLSEKPLTAFAGNKWGVSSSGLTGTGSPVPLRGARGTYRAGNTMLPPLPPTRPNSASARSDYLRTPTSYSTASPGREGPLRFRFVGQLHCTMETLDFWTLHRQLGECYQLNVEAMQDETNDCRQLSPSTAVSTAVSLPPARVPLLKERPKSLTQPLEVPLPEDDIQVLEMSPSGGLWQSAAFKQDLQACRVQLAKKRSMESMGTSMVDDEQRLDAADFEGSAVFNPRCFWTEQIESAEEDQIRNLNVSTRRVSLVSRAPNTQHIPKPRISCFRAGFQMIQHPGSSLRAWWDTLGMMMLAYDLVVIPLRVFDIGESMFLTVMFWVAHLYWNLAIPISFITGYDDAGVLVLDLTKTAKNYGTSWLLRLGRAVRIGTVIQSIQEQLTSRMANIQYSILKIIIQLVLSNHIIACLWFGLGAFHDSESSWVEELDLENQSTAYQYATSLHWAFSQLGVGQTEIEAVNLNERIFSVVISFLGFINFSTMVSSMTSLLASLQRLKSEELEQFSLLKHFLSQNNIDPDLSHRVTRFLKHTHAMKNMALSKDCQLPILAMLSRPLQEELQLQRHYDILSEGAFFEKLLHDDSRYNFHRVVCDLVTSCMSHSLLALDDIAFVEGSIATACYYVADGACRYDTPSMKPSRLRNLWVAEMCLWTPWLHMGDLVSKDITRLITVEVTAFCECMARDQAARRMAATYARDFLHRLNKKKHWSDLEPETRTLQARTPQKQSSKGGWCPRSVFSKVLPS